MCCLFGFTLEYVDKSSESGPCCLYPKVVNVIGLEPQKQAESSDRLERGVRLCQASSSMTLVLSKMGKEHPFAECSSYRLALGLKKDQRLPWHSQSLCHLSECHLLKGPGFLNKTTFLHRKGWRGINHHKQICLCSPAHAREKVHSRKYFFLFFIKNVFLYSSAVLYNMMFIFTPQLLSLPIPGKPFVLNNPPPTPMLLSRVLVLCFLGEHLEGGISWSRDSLPGALLPLKKRTPLLLATNTANSSSGKDRALESLLHLW